MAQLRHDYSKFQALNTEIVVVVPNGQFMINRTMCKNRTPLIILTDKWSKIASLYFQVKQFFSLGTPMVPIIDQNGKIDYAYYAASVLEEPGTEEPLSVLIQLKTQ
jgi:peroxiredoxin